MQVNIQIARPFLPLITQHHRIKLYYGGRGGGKSYAFADALLVRASSEKLFIVCLREVQESIRDSVYKLLCDRIAKHGLVGWQIKSDEIVYAKNGSRIVFKGLRDQDPQKIKSLEGADIAWIEEAQTITKKSWEILEPTIRKDGSEIWISMNREEENDPIWVAVGNCPDERTLVVKVNYDDNPFCPEELRIQAEKCKCFNPEDYNHIWLGDPVRQGHTKLISSAVVRRAFEAKMSGSTSPLIIGLDIARFGDDSTVFCFRKGRYCVRFETYRQCDTVEVANMTTNFIRKYQPTRIFMDIGGQGAGVYDILKDRGYGKIVRGVYFGEKAINTNRYMNRRAEMWDSVREWLDDVVQLPPDEELLDELVSVNKKYDRLGRLQLEEKSEVKKRLGRSPDKADALALTFATPVYDNGEAHLYGNGKITIEDMFREAEKERRHNEGGW